MTPEELWPLPDLLKHMDPQFRLGYLAARAEGLASRMPRAPHPLPLWQECAAKADRREELTPLEQFVYDNEPTNADAGWRELLAAAIEEVRG